MTPSQAAQEKPTSPRTESGRRLLHRRSYWSGNNAIRDAILAIEAEAAQGAAARAEGRREAVRLDTRCANCWHDKGHHVHWSDDRIGACVLVYGGGQGRCPCEQYAARPGRSSDPTEADDE